MANVLAQKQPSDSNTKSIEDNLRMVRNAHFSIFEEVKARLDVVMNATYYYVRDGLPEDSQKKFNPLMLLTFDSFFKLNELSLDKCNTLKEPSKGELDNYFEMRAHLLAASDFLSKGLPVNAANELVGALGALKTEPQKIKSSNELSSFWKNYSSVMNYYKEMFRIAFPDTYNPNESDKFTSAISKVIDFESEIIDAYKHNDLEDAKETLFSFETFMKEFVVSRARITPV